LAWRNCRSFGVVHGNSRTNQRGADSSDGGQQQRFAAIEVSAILRIWIGHSVSF
jgi:hypothetical protein